MIIDRKTYANFVKCPRKCWYGQFKPEEEHQTDPDECKQIKDAQIVREYAKLYFNHPLNVAKYRPDGEIDIDESVLGTQEAIKNGMPVIANATFRKDDLLCAVDYLVKTDGGYDFYAVKASKSVKKDKHYEDDAAFQEYVLRLCSTPVSHAYLLILNKDYTRHGALDIKQLFLPVPLDGKSEYVDAQSKVKSKLAKIRAVISDPSKSHDDFCSSISKCKKCGFKNCCYGPLLDEPSIFCINNLRNGLKEYNRGVKTYADIRAKGTEKPLNARQMAQVDSYLDGKKAIIDKPALKREFLDKLTYPIYHLDFETIEPVIPLSDNAEPLIQIPTQYSLHIEHKDGTLEHKDFLGTTLDPRREIAKSLVKNIPDDVTVLAYSKKFECARLKELADYCPDLRDHLLAIRDNIQDLEVPFDNGYYYAAGMGGSNSIKQVLPALCPNDPELDYHALPTVHNGAEAMDEYPKMLEARGADQKKMREGLLKYCRLDTLAMVKILEKLREAAK